MAVLSLSNAHLAFGHVALLDGAAFSLESGERLGLIGRNGAGKSTLLRLIGGVDTPDHGRVVTDKRISWPVGLSGGLQGSLTGRDSVKFVCRVYGALGEAMREKIRFVEDFAEIGPYFDQPVKTYSSGMRARLNFGLSWAFDFDYYLMDEIGAVGDARFKQKSRQLMEQRIGRSNVILVSHAMPEIARLCNVVVLVNDGQASLYQDVDEGIRVYQEQANIVPQKRMRNAATGGVKRPGKLDKNGLAGRTAAAPSEPAEQTIPDTKN